MTPYIPDELPLQSLDWTKFISLIGSANAELARYDATLQAIVNPQVLLSPLTTQEAVLSSKIEGTRTSLITASRIGWYNWPLSTRSSKSCTRSTMVMDASVV